MDHDLRQKGGRVILGVPRDSRHVEEREQPGRGREVRASHTTAKKGGPLGERVTLEGPTAKRATEMGPLVVSRERTRIRGREGSCAAT